MKIDEIVKSNKLNYLNEGIGQSLYNIFIRTLGVATGGMIGAGAGALAGIFAAPIGYYIAGPTVGNIAGGASLALGTAIGAWLFDRKVQEPNIQEEKIYSVFVNGRRVSGNNLDYREASKKIAEMAIKEHDPKTYYTIYDNSTKSVVWRYMISEYINDKER